jgi:hypothetical protein
MSPAIVMRGRAAAVVAIFIAPILLDAQAPPARKVETFTGTTTNLKPGAREKLKIDVFRWSADAEREALLTSVKEKGDGSVGEALAKTPTAGYVWDTGPIGYSVRYAYKTRMADGTERIILVTDRPLGGQVWKPAGNSPAPAYSFTLIELRLNKQGRGEGKMSLAAKVTVDSEAGTVALENYAAAPVLIDSVTRTAGVT